jgi:hypothetical protein
VHSFAHPPEVDALPYPLRHPERKLTGIFGLVEFCKKSEQLEIRSFPGRLAAAARQDKIKKRVTILEFYALLVGKFSTSLDVGKINFTRRTSTWYGDGAFRAQQTYLPQDLYKTRLSGTFEKYRTISTEEPNPQAPQAPQEPQEPQESNPPKKSRNETSRIWVWLLSSHKKGACAA